MPPPSPNPLPLKGREGLFFLSPLPEGEGWVRALFFIFVLVPRLRGENGYCSSTTVPYLRHCEAHRAEATQGNISIGPCQTPGLLRFARNDAVR